MQVYWRLSIAIFCLVQTSCNSSRNKVPASESLPIPSIHTSCDTSKVDSLLKTYAEAFIPSKIGLDKCLPYSFNILFNKIDSNCLRSLPHYKYSILLILLKLYEYHIRVGHQGYDLYLMKSGASNILINEFELIGGYNKEQLEMLNSGTILDVIDKEQVIKSNQVIKKYYEKIKITITQLYN